MFVPVVLGVCAFLVLVLSPKALALAPWQLRHPRSALAIWIASFVIGLSAAFAALATSIVIASASPDSSAHGEVITATLVSWMVLGMAGGAIAFGMSVAHPLSGAPARPAATVSREQHVGFTLVRTDDQVPGAYSIPGRHPEIIVSTGLERSLTSAEFGAVLAHEYAHLRQHHAMVLQGAAVNAAFLGFLPAGRALRRAAKVLVELAADDAAARQIGPAHLANALTRLGESTEDSGMIVRAERLADKRWPPRHRRRVPRRLRASFSLS